MKCSQFKGLVIKNIQLISRQKGSIICQIITPILCLGFIALIKLIVEENLSKTGLTLKIQQPILFNIPIYQKLQYSNQPVRITNCDEWYLYDYDKDTPEEDKQFFGYNEGDGSQSTGMLTSQVNVLQKNCSRIDRKVPYFQRSTNETLNEDLYARLDMLNKLDFNDLKKERGLEIIPDGAVLVKKANEKEFSYRLQVNDNRFPFYHRTNGVSKYSLLNESTGKYKSVLSVINGVLWVADLFNRAYLKHFFPDLFIVSGVQIMPYHQDDSENIQRIINVAGSTFYPMAISLLMPLFMYTIVLEKEGKLIEIMKINGMKMTYYWLSVFVFNFILYVITMVVFVITGGLVLQLSLFTSTNFALQGLVYLGWGLCQIGMAFFFQAFLNNARTATSKFP